MGDLGVQQVCEEGGAEAVGAELEVVVWSCFDCGAVGRGRRRCEEDVEASV